MANIGNADYEDDGGNSRGDYDGPNSPLITTAGIGNPVKSYGDAALNEDSARGVEVLGDEKVLCQGSVSLYSSGYRRGSTHLGPVHSITRRQIDSKLTRSEIAADNA